SNVGLSLEFGSRARVVPAHLETARKREFRIARDSPGSECGHRGTSGSAAERLRYDTASDHTKQEAGNRPADGWADHERCCETSNHAGKQCPRCHAERVGPRRAVNIAHHSGMIEFGFKPESITWWVRSAAGRLHAKRGSRYSISRLAPLPRGG